MRSMPLLLALCACAPAIVVPPRTAVERTERSAREVELCVLFQERFTRPRYNGVAELSFEPWDFAIASVAVKHPSAGLVIIDPAFGRSIGRDLELAGPMVMLLMGTERGKQSLVDVMDGAGLSASDVQYALATHTHWDHIGALGDLPNAKVLLPRSELTWNSPFHGSFDHGVMTHHLKRAKQNLWAFDFNGPPIDGFAASFDVFGDGSIVAVPIPGHTPGSTAFLVRGKERTYLFTGDATWTSRGIELPAHKLLTAVDFDLPTLAETIGRLKAFNDNRPDVKIIPAHDGAALASLPQCKPGQR